MFVDATKMEKGQEALCELKIHLKKTHAELAPLIGISQQTLSWISSGKRMSLMSYYKLMNAARNYIPGWK